MPRPLPSAPRSVPSRRNPRRSGRRDNRGAHAAALPGARLVALLLLSLVGAPGMARAGDGWVTLLHTNDIHGAYQARPADWLNQKPLAGGFLALAGTVEEIRASGQPFVLVDAGDLMAGTPLTRIVRDGVPGGGAMAFMNAIGYDAMALGNHEFDQGRGACEGLLGLARFPVLCANLVERATGVRFAPAAHLVVERGGVRVALIGLILDDLASVVAAEPIKDLEVRRGAEVARAEVELVDPESDVIVVVAHEGLDACRALARAVPGIDVIIAGHDHRRTEKPIVESGVIIVETGAQLQRLGRLDLRVAGDRVVEHRFELLELMATAGDRAPAAMKDLYAELDAGIQAEYGQTVAEVAVPLVRDDKTESNLGDWVTDAMRAAAGADFAVTNSTGLRADVDSGPLTRFEVMSVVPFPNVLCTFRATGAQILEFARRNAGNALGRAHDGREHSIVQVSGLRYAYAPDGEIYDLAVDGAPVELARSYLGATSDFIVQSQAEKYLGFVPAETAVTPQLIFDLLCAAAARESPIAVRVEGRIRALAAAPAGAVPVGLVPSGKSAGGAEESSAAEPVGAGVR